MQYQDVNYKSDLSLILHLIDADEQPIAFPDYPFRLRFWTVAGAKSVTLRSSDPAVKNVDGDIAVFLDNHGLPPGVLNVELIAEIPDGNFPDLSERIVMSAPTIYRLRTHLSAAPASMRLTMPLPVVVRSLFEQAHAMGYEGTEADFHDALTDLPHVVGDARAAVDNATQAVNVATEASQSAMASSRNAVQAVADARSAIAGANTSALFADRAAQAAREAAAAANTVNNLTEQSLADLTDAMASLDDVPRLGSENHFRAEQHFDGGLTASSAEVGELHVAGDIVQRGEAYVTHAEDVRTATDYITLRDGAQHGLPAGERAGLKAVKYDGTHDGELAFDSNGVARVGDVGDTQPLMTRSESEAMTHGALLEWDGLRLKAKTTDKRVATVAANIPDGALFVWDASSNCAKGLSVRVVEMEATFEADDDHEEDYTETFLILCRNEI